MDFDDSPHEASFRAQARAWLAAHAPTAFHEALAASAAQTTSSVHLPHLPGLDEVAESKAWQARKAADGWACIHWPAEYGGRSASPIERVVWQQEEGAYAQLSNLFVVGHGLNHAAENVGVDLSPFQAASMQQVGASHARETWHLSTTRE